MLLMSMSTHLMSVYLSQGVPVLNASHKQIREQMLLVTCTFNIVCLSFVEFDFLLKKNKFSCSEEPPVFTAKLQETGAMLSQTSHSPIKGSYLRCSNCNQLQKMTLVDWPQELSPDLALLFLTFVLLCVFVLILSHNYVHFILHISYLRDWNVCLLRAGFFAH